jgi:hypothetical protein
VNDNDPKLSVSDRFSRAAQWTSQQCGRAYTFVGAIVIIVAWAISGPAFHYSDTWQLIISLLAGTTIITFLMVFLRDRPESGGATVPRWWEPGVRDEVAGRVGAGWSGWDRWHS